MSDFVHMHHPDVNACAEAPREAFETVWAEKGWTEAETHEGQTVLTHELEELHSPETSEEKPRKGGK